MLPVYFSKELAFVARSNFVVMPHFSNLDVFSENLCEILGLNKSEFNFINVSSNLNIPEKVIPANDEIFVDEALFYEIKNLDQDSFIYFDKYYQHILQNLEIAGSATFLTITDSKLLYELGYSYFTKIFKEKPLEGAVYFTGLSNFSFTSEYFLNLISDVYSGEGLVKVYISNLMGQHVKENAKLIGSIFFGSGKTQILADFGIDEEHKINITQATRVKIDLGKKTTKVIIKNPTKEYRLEIEEGEVGFFVDLRDKPIKNKSILQNKIFV